MRRWTCGQTNIKFAVVRKEPPVRVEVSDKKDSAVPIKKGALKH